MKIKKSDWLYFTGLLFFSLLLVFSTVQKVKLYINNEYAEGLYIDGFVYIYKDNKITEERYDAVTDTKITNNREVSFFYNKETKTAYVLNYNRIIREEFFIIIFIALFLILIVKNKKT